MEISYDLLYFPIITLAVIFVETRIECLLARRRRFKLATFQRQNYYHKIAQEKQMEEHQSERRIATLKLEVEEIENKLGKDDHVNSPVHYDNKDVIKKSIENLKQKRDQLKIVEELIIEILQRVGLDDSNDSDLSRKIRNLEEENKKLKSQVSQHLNPPLPPRQTELDQELLDYMEKNDEMTIDFLKKAYETLLEMKASYPNRDLSDYASKLNKSPTNYDSELTKLEIIRKKVEKKLEQTKRHYNEEFNTFYEVRIEYMFKNTGAQELLARLKEKNYIVEEIVKKKNGRENGLVDGQFGDYFTPVPDVDEDDAL